MFSVPYQEQKQNICHFPHLDRKQCWGKTMTYSLSHRAHGPCTRRNAHHTVYRLKSLSYIIRLI